MKLRTIGAAVLRRWYMFVAGLLAVGGLSYLLYGMIPVDYKTTGSLVLLPSSKAVGIGGNPYLFLGGLSQAMDVLTRRMTAPDVSEKLGEQFPRSSYTVQPDVTSGSSIMVATVRAPTPRESSELLDAVLSQAPKQLSAMQDELKVPDESRISSMQVAQPPDPIVDGKPRFQAVVGAGAAGLLVVLLMTAFLDGVLLRRRAAGRQNRKPDRGGGAPLSHYGPLGRAAPEKELDVSGTNASSTAEEVHATPGPSGQSAASTPLTGFRPGGDHASSDITEAAEDSDLVPLRRRAATGDRG